MGIRCEGKRLPPPGNGALTPPGAFAILGGPVIKPSRMYLDFSTPDDLARHIAARPEAAAHPLWLVLLADWHGEALAEIAATLESAGIRACGALFPGLIDGGAVRHKGAIVVALPGESRWAIADLAPGSVSWRQPPPSLEGCGDVSSIVLVDCLGPNVAGLLEALYDLYGHGLPQFGAGAGYHDLRVAPTLFAAGSALANAGLTILVPERFTVRVRHGWRRVRGPFVASRTRGSKLLELNWEPAGRFYRQQVEAENPALTGRPVFPDLNSSYPLGIGRDGSEDVIRDPMGVDEADQGIALLSDLRENTLLYLVHGDRGSLVAAAREAVAACAAPGDVARCLVSDCFSRALMLGDAFPEELAAVGEELAKFTATRPEGVLALGEIATDGRQPIEFFNKTFVVALAHTPS